MLRTGTAVDAMVISAPSSTKNSEGERDPEMHQTRKGNNWYFGMMAQIGVDTDSGLVHTVVGTAANVSDINVAGQLLHGEEEVAFGDSGYRSVQKRRKAAGPNWHVAMRPGQRRKLNPFLPLDTLTEQVEQKKTSIRVKGQHPFQVGWRGANSWRWGKSVWKWQKPGLLSKGRSSKSRRTALADLFETQLPERGRLFRPSLRNFDEQSRPQWLH